MSAPGPSTQKAKKQRKTKKPATSNPTISDSDEEDGNANPATTIKASL